MKKITVGVSIAAVVVIIIVSLNMGNSGVSSPPNPSPTTIPATNVSLPTTNSPKHFDLSLDERMKFRT